MTDNTSADEMFDLCRQVYEATGWKDTHDKFRANGFKVTWGFSGWRRGEVPLYNSDYLLEKLPRKNLSLMLDEISNLWRATWGRDLFSSERFRGVSDTPLKALLKLTIALSEAGELDNE